MEGSYHIQYSPGYEFGTWDANGSLSIANVSDMSTDVVVSGPGSLMVRGSIKNVTYVQDDGSPDYSIGRSKGGMVASSFSPMFAGNLTRVRIYIWRACTYTNNTALVHVLSVNGTELISPVPIDPKAPGWLEILIKEAVTMTDDFLVAVEYLNDNCPRIGVDDHSKGASMTRWSSTWRNYHQNIMIRCEIVNLQPPRRITRISLNFDGHDPVAGSVIGVEGALDPGISEAEVTFVLSSPSGRREQCILTTDPHGRFSTSFIPMEMGEWGVSAGWEGTSEYLSSQTATHLQVGKGSVSLICRVEPFASRFNDTIMVMGSVVPVPVPTTLQYRSNGGEWITISEVKPSDNLTFALAWTPPGVGTYELRAMWPGNDSLTGDATYAVLHLVRQAHSEITMDFDEATTRYGLRVTVSGHMSPPQSAPILLRFWKDVGWQDLAVTSSGIDGHFSYVWPVDFVGMVLVQASWEGNKDYKGTQSNGVILRSEKATSSMSCQAEPTMAEPDTSIIVQGRIVPPLEIPVRITVTPPEGTQTEMVSTTNVTGDYVATFDPDQLGEWRILASWNGNHVYEGCVSSQLSIEVEAPFLLAAFPVIVVLVLKRQVRAWQSTGL